MENQGEDQGEDQGKDQGEDQGEEDQDMQRGWLEGKQRNIIIDWSKETKYTW